MKKGSDALLLIWDRIGDYHSARIKACEQLFPGGVFSADLAGTDKLYKWASKEGNSHTVLSVKPAEQSDIWTRFKNFRTLVKRENIQTIATPYGRTEYLLFLLYAKCKGMRTIVFCESWYPRSNWKDRLKGMLLNFIGTYFFVSGKRAFDHLTKRYGIPPKRVVEGYSVTDNLHFQNTTSFEQRKNIVLCVARYSPEKNLALLIKAFLRSEMSRSFTLHIVGDGPLRNELKEIADPDKVVFLPWTVYTALPEVYSESKLFILPSTFEPWGLVVNEAMAAGLPVLASDVCGCVPDLIRQGENGDTFPHQDEEALHNLFNRWSQFSNKELESMGRKSFAIIQSFSPVTWAQTIQAMKKDFEK